MLNACSIVIGLYLYSLVVNYKKGKRPEPDDDGWFIVYEVSTAFIDQIKLCSHHVILHVKEITCLWKTIFQKYIH